MQHLCFHYRISLGKSENACEIITGIFKPMPSLMYSGLTTRNKGRFHRVSRARIFDGNPLKINVYALSIMTVTFVIITGLVALLFSLVHKTDYSLIFWVLLPGGLLGFVMLVTERSLTKLKIYLLPRMGKLLTAFLMFFTHIICYLALSSIIVSYPLGYIMERILGLNGMGSQYSLFSGNFFILLALLSWLRNVRNSSYRCF
jgi:hypothetical protein